MNASFCKDFSWIFGHPQKFDCEFQGEILKIEKGNLEDFTPKNTVKPRAIFKTLIFNGLQNLRKNVYFVKYFYQFSTMSLSISKVEKITLLSPHA